MFHTAAPLPSGQLPYTVYLDIISAINSSDDIIFTNTCMLNWLVLMPAKLLIALQPYC